MGGTFFLFAVNINNKCMTNNTSFIQEETLIYGSWSFYQSTIKKRSIDVGSRTFFFIKESIQRRFDDLSVLGVD